MLTAFDRARPRTKCYLILDEYQYLCEVQPALSSILRRHWDATWRTAPLTVVPCGSVVSMMYWLVSAKEMVLRCLIPKTPAKR